MDKGTPLAGWGAGMILLHLGGPTKGDADRSAGLEQLIILSAKQLEN